ncbi:MAG: hypothetical protein Athens071416_397 [Parcubacteria group bacterium Athens0714_16]|nr:MAG: hypothetical protein Athens071416_397 [Parcubacteria group bacterium Athens0714_16]
MKTPGDEKMITRIIKNRFGSFILGAVFLFIFFILQPTKNDRLQMTIDPISMKKGLFLFFLASLFCFYISICSYIIFYSFRRKIIMTVKETHPNILSCILRLVGMTYCSGQEITDAHLISLEFKISNSKNDVLQNLAHLFLKNEARILEKNYVMQEYHQDMLDALLTREQNKKPEKVVFKTDMVPGEKIEDSLKKNVEDKKIVKKFKQRWTEAKTLVKMLGFNVWSSHILYLKLDPNSLL